MEAQIVSVSQFSSAELVHSAFLQSNQLQLQLSAQLLLFFFFKKHDLFLSGLMYLYVSNIKELHSSLEEWGLWL